MNTIILVLFVILFFLSTGFFYVLLTTTSELHPIEKLRSLSSGSGHWFDRFWVSLAQRVETWLKPVSPESFQDTDWQKSALKLKFIQAGLRGRYVVALYFTAKILLAFALPLMWMIAQTFTVGSLPKGINILLIFALGIAGLFLPDLAVRAMTAHRQRQILDHFPDSLDLIRICIEAGLGLDTAILRVGEEFKQISPVVHEEFHLISLELRAGATRQEALRSFALRTGLKETATFASVLGQSDRFGTGIASAIQIHADDVRHGRKMRAEEIAAKISTKLLFPLIFCIFPALLLVLLGPAGISVYENLVSVPVK